MRGLIYKDFYLIRNKIFVSVFALVSMYAMMYIVAFLLRDVVNINAYAAAAITDINIIYFIGFYNCNYIIRADAGKLWNYYGISLPEGIRGLVSAKYMAVFIMYFIAFTMCVINDIICGLVFGKSVDMSMLFLAETFFLILIDEVEMPLAFRFGTDKASVIRVLLTVVIVFVIAVYLLFGNIEWLMAEDGLVNVFPKVISQMGENSDVMTDEAKKLIEKITFLNYIEAAVVMHLIVLGYYISYRISCKVFRKGCLRDDI